MSPTTTTARFQDKQIEMAHGAGGEASRRLIERLFAPAFSNPILEALSDAAVLDAPPGRIAMTTDSFVPCGIYVGTTSGQVFYSRDDGDSWELLIEYLPPINSVDCSIVV